MTPSLHAISGLLDNIYIFLAFHLKKDLLKYGKVNISSRKIFCSWNTYRKVFSQHIVKYDCVMQKLCCVSNVYFISSQ